MQQHDYAAAPSYTVDADADVTVNSNTTPMLSAGSLPSQCWKMMESEIPASLSNEGNDLASNLHTLQEAIETRVWATYSVTSMQHRPAQSKTANNNIQMIILISNQAMSEDEHLRIYTAILKTLAKAYHNWKFLCSEPQKDRHSEKSVSPVHEAKQGNHALRNQEGICHPAQTQHSVMRDPIETANALGLPSQNNISNYNYLEMTFLDVR